MTRRAGERIDNRVQGTFARFCTPQNQEKPCETDLTHVGFVEPGGPSRKALFGSRAPPPTCARVDTAGVKHASSARGLFRPEGDLSRGGSKARRPATTLRSSPLRSTSAAGRCWRCGTALLRPRTARRTSARCSSRCRSRERSSGSGPPAARRRAAAA